MNARLPLAAALVAALTTLASAIEVPKKVPLNRYTDLWTESPFTTKPPPVAPVVEESVFKDMALRGISPLPNGGYLLTVIMDKKHPEDTDIINTARSTEWKVTGVERDPVNRLGTVVHLEKNGKVGTITYDEKISSAPKTAQTAKQQPGAPPQQQLIPGQPQNPAAPPALNGVRQPRQRVVSPVAPGTVPQPGASSNGFNRGGFPARPGSSSGRPDSRGSGSRFHPSGR